VISREVRPATPKEQKAWIVDPYGFFKKPKGGVTMTPPTKLTDWEQMFSKMIAHYYMVCGSKGFSEANPDYIAIVDFVEAVIAQELAKAKEEERRFIGKELWKWFNGNHLISEDIETIIERLTQIPNPKLSTLNKK
jgi:hypothetical protein